MVQHIDNDDEPYKCDEIYHQKQQVTAHQENVHVGELSSQYDVCGNCSIVNSDDLLYERSLREKTFSSKYNNITHQKFQLPRWIIGNDIVAMKNLMKKMSYLSLRIILKDVCGKVVFSKWS